MEITIPFIKKMVEEYFELPEGSIDLKTRKREIVQSRQTAMFFAKSMTKFSLFQIGLQIGNKDHATVLHACKTVNNLIDTDKQFKIDVEEIEKKLKTFNEILREEINNDIKNALMERFSTLIAERNYLKKYFVVTKKTDMKRFYQNEQVVDFQGRSKRQQTDNEKLGCFTLILFLVFVGIMILINTFKN